MWPILNGLGFGDLEHLEPRIWLLVTDYCVKERRVSKPHSLHMTAELFLESSHQVCFLSMTNHQVVRVIMGIPLISCPTKGHQSPLSVFVFFNCPENTLGIFNT